MRIESIQIKNFKSIESENLDLNGNNVYVLGSNGKGKSSFIDAVFKILTGKDLPSKIVKEGEQRGMVEINLGNHIVKAIFNAKDEKVSLSVTTPEGALYSSPRKMLDEMIGVIDFDINGFFSLSPAKQVDFIKNLVGIDFSDLDDDYKKFYDERTFTNRKIKELEPQQVPFGKQTVEIDIKELQVKVETANKHNQSFQDIVKRSQERENKIALLQKEVADLQVSQGKAIDWLAHNKPVDVTAIKKEFDEAIEHNKQVAHNVKAKILKDELLKHIEQKEVWEDNLKAIEETKRRVISEAKMPIDGLTFDDNQLLLNGLPFEKSQINTAQQIITGLQINNALLKDVKIARFDGSLIDNENMKAVESWAKKQGLQLFVEFVSRDKEGLTIEIQEPC